MTERLIDILPLLHQLHEKKPITQGLMSSPVLAHAEWPGNWQSVDLQHLEGLPFTIRYDLAVVDLRQPSGSIKANSHDKDKLGLGNATTLKNTADHSVELKSITHGLTRLRDLLARQVLVLAEAEYNPVLHALGFSQIEQLTPHTTIWQFNILSYKQIPDWLNSKYWANPENWDKYRW